MKILIAGCGQVGETLAQELSSEKHDITLIDSDPRVLQMGMERYDVIAFEGNCATMKTLEQAGVMDADLLIACTGSDELNLLSCMTAHTMNPNLHTIARIRDPEYTEQTYKMRDAFALSMVFNPEHQAAREIARLLKFPGFLKRDSFAKGRVEIVEVRVDKDSRLQNVALNQLSGIIKCRVLVCAVLRNGVASAPAGSFVLEEGDRIFVTASTDNLATLLKNLGIVTHKVRNVVLIGGGKVAYYLAEMLQESGMDLTMIESDEERCRELAISFPHADIIHGDARDQSLLESEGVSKADAVVSLTGLDELNMMLALYAKHCEVPQIITRVEYLDEAGIMGKLSLGSTVCPRKLCCNNVVRYVRAMQNQVGAAVTLHSIADGQAEALEFHVDEHALHCGEPLKKLKLRANVLLVAISSGSKTEIPGGDSSFRVGDNVIVVASGDTVIHQFNDIFA